MNNFEIDIDSILNIGILLSTEKDPLKLLDVIITEAMRITNCDAGTLYVCQGEFLHFAVMRTISQNIFKGGEKGEISLPPVPKRLENVCAYVAIKGESINIADVYHSDEFDFSGPKTYDTITGYKTTSMMVIPLKCNTGEVLGVLQLINAQDLDKNIVPFSRQSEKVILSLSAQAAMSVTNMRYTEDIKKLFYSVIEVMTTAIDERSPYNANHTKNLTRYTERLVDCINEAYKVGECPYFFDDEHKERIIMSAWLHDVGKLVTPVEVMNKSTRLDRLLPIVLSRISVIRAQVEIAYAQRQLLPDAYQAKIDQIHRYQELICRANAIMLVDEQMQEQLKEIASHTFINESGEVQNYLTDYELECLCIPRGTLTVQERNVMQQHVVVTQRLLSKIKFFHQFEDVPAWAAGHHEMMDGSGYPGKLTAKDIPVEMRILAIMDIYEALTSDDRPYKRALPHAQAIEILQDMVDHAKLDGNIVAVLAKNKLLD